MKRGGKKQKTSTWLILFRMLQQLTENKDFIFVNRGADEAVSVLLVVWRCREGEETTITYSKNYLKRIVLHMPRQY